MKYAILGALLAVTLCAIPAFWADACVAIAVWACRHGFVSEAFAPSLGQSLVPLPFLIIIFSAGGYAINYAMRADRTPQGSEEANG